MKSGSGINLTHYHYMTNGEKWKIDIKPVSKLKKIDTGRLELQTKDYDTICLLSGGLDSLSGSIVEKNNKTIYVTTGINDTEVINAKYIYNNILKKESNTHIIINKYNLSMDSHYTQRTRTLFFIANTFIYADYFKIDKIKIYENGIMSLNPKFYFRRIVTKTTHPKTIYLINKVLNELNINISVINPYMYLTKAQVLNEIPEGYRNKIKFTKTCSKNHGIQALSNRKKGETHCGLCTACILRQISILNSKFKEDDVAYMLPANIRNKSKIKKYEKQISKPNKEHLIEKYSNYKYTEKKSLLEYYERYYKLIKTGDIYNYLDLNPKYFDEDSYYNKIIKMLNKFGEEIEKYLKNME